MKKTLLFIGIVVVAVLLIHSYKLNENEAANIAIQSVIDAKLTNLSKDCIFLAKDQENYKQITFEIRENHNASCGGDPRTGPRIASVVVNLYTHSVKNLN